MKIGLYTNKSKDIGGVWSKKLISLFEQENIECVDIESDFTQLVDCIVVLGGDGTILGLTSYAANNNVPIIGINAGKLGFLTEFETFEMAQAVKFIKNGKLKPDKRIITEVNVGDEVYYALNDCIVQRIFNGQEASLVVDLRVSLDGTLVDRIVGDGVIVCTPTGSTAYSLSAGGAILAPGINAFSITPISAHSLHHRPIVYSADSICEITDFAGGSAGLFCDGKLVKKLSSSDRITIKKSSKTVTFLRKVDSSFYNRLLLKLNTERK